MKLDRRSLFQAIGAAMLSASMHWSGAQSALGLVTVEAAAGKLEQRLFIDREWLESRPTVPALLEPGEFIIPKQTAKAFADLAQAFAGNVTEFTKWGRDE